MVCFILFLLGLSVLCMGENVQRTHMISNFAEITATAVGLFVTPTQSDFEKINMATQSLKTFGEWRRYESYLLCAFLKEGDLMVEVGGQFGAQTVPFSKCVGPTGRVATVEWNPKIFYFLGANLASNDISNVIIKHVFLGNQTATLSYDKIDADIVAAVKLAGNANTNNDNSIAFQTLDDVLNFVDDDTYLLLTEEEEKVIDSKLHKTAPQCPKVLKVDVKTLVGRDLSVLQGARILIQQCRPIIYTSLDCVEDSRNMISFLQEEMAYDVSWHLPAPVRPENDFAAPVGLAYAIPSVNILAYPVETPMDRRVTDDVTVPVTNNEHDLSKVTHNFIHCIIYYV